MGYYGLIVPQSCVNLVTNPSAETATTGWGAAVAGGTVTQDDAHARFGVQSIKIVTGGTQYAGGRYTQTVASTNPGSVSLYVWSAAASIYLQVVDNTSARFQGALTIPTSRWVRIRAQNLVVTSGTLHVDVVAPTTTDITIWVDGLQFEAGATCTTYADGDQPGCTWAGTAHASTTTRPATARGGGALVDFNTYNCYVTSAQGLGMPPIAHNTQTQAFQPGALYQSSKVGTRTITLTIAGKGTSRSNLHDLRQDLINALKPDETPGDQPLLLRYNTGTDGTNVYSDEAMTIGCYYAGGLEMSVSGGGGYTETIPLRLLAVDPYWSEDDQDTADCTMSQNVANANAIIGRVAGQWQALGAGLAVGAGSIYGRAMATAYDGTLYVGGLFTTAGAVAAASIAKWNGAAWAALGTGLAGGTLQCRALLIAPDGTLYAGGGFTTAGGNAAAYIAKWDGSSWAALGTGLTGGVACDALAMASDGTLYAGGSFTTAGGSAIAKIASWNGSTWSAVGTGLSGGTGCWTLAFDAAGNLYAGGDFTTAGAVAAAGIAKWDGSAWVAASTGVSGGTSTVWCIEPTPDGGLFVGGNFTTAGGVAASNIAQYNGTSFAALGSGANNVVYFLHYAADGTLYAAGGFTAAGGITLADRLATWTGSTWRAVDADLPGSAIGYAFGEVRGNIYLGYDTTGTGTAAGVTTATNNGTATAYPVIKVTGPGTLQRIENYTAGAVLYFNLAINTGETVTIDCRPGQRSITSDWRGNLYPQLQAGSDFALFRLLPGANTIIAYMSGTSGAAAIRMYWQRRDWSVDQAGNL